MPWVWPIAGRVHIEQRFGENPDWSIYRNSIAPGVNGHPGMDLWSLRDPVDQTPILASADGEVIIRGESTAFPLRGRVLYLDHLGSDFSTRYYHLSQIFVELDDQVKQGEVIAMMGRSGTGDPWEPGKPPRWHLHFGLWSKAQQRFVDPKLLLS